MRPLILKALQFDPWRTDPGYRIQMAARVIRGKPTICHAAIEGIQLNLHGAVAYKSSIRITGSTIKNTIFIGAPRNGSSLVTLKSPL